MAMSKFKRRHEVVRQVEFLTEFSPDEVELKARYGLPRTVHFCTNCVISNQRPNSSVEYQHRADSLKATIEFDEHGVCDACRVAEQKSTSISWEDRELALRELCDRHRSDGRRYDCLVPGSGGKDSFIVCNLFFLGSRTFGSISKPRAVRL